MLTADVPHALFLPVGVNASDLGLTLGAGTSAVSAALTVVSESESNNTIATANIVNLGFGAGKDDEVDVNGILGGGDSIYLFRMELKAGDIFGAGVSGGGLSLTLLDAAGTELVGSSGDVTFIHPASSPLPGGNAALSWVIDADALHIT